MTTLKELMDRVEEDISICCLASCPICDEEFDADSDTDTYAVMEHIKSSHTKKELEVYLK